MGYAVIIAILGALAGDSRTTLALRRVFLPGWLAVLLHSPFPLLLIAVFSIGYGLPDKTDKGSPLGRLAVKVAGGYADYLARAILGGLAGFVLALSSGKVGYPMVMVIFALGSVLAGKTGIKITMAGYSLLLEDLIFYFGVGLSVA